MSSILQDIAYINGKAKEINRDDQDRMDYTLIMDTLADIQELSSQVLLDVRDEIQNELDSRVTCHVCGKHAHGIFHRGDWECDECRRWK